LPYCSIDLLNNVRSHLALCNGLNVIHRKSVAEKLLKLQFERFALRPLRPLLGFAV
jgi:hypothetical protein